MEDGQVEDSLFGHVQVLPARALLDPGLVRDGHHGVGLVCVRVHVQSAALR